MAEEFVSRDQFEEFTKRMEQGFAHADQRHSDLLTMIDQRFAHADQRHSDLLTMIDQRFAHADQRHSDLLTMIDQRFAHADQRHSDLLDAMNQRFDQVNERFVDTKADMASIRADMRQMRGWLVGLYGLVVFGFLGSIVITIFKDKFFN